MSNPESDWTCESDIRPDHRVLRDTLATELVRVYAESEQMAEDLLEQGRKY